MKVSTVMTSGRVPVPAGIHRTGTYEDVDGNPAVEKQSWPARVSYRKSWSCCMFEEVRDSDYATAMRTS